MVFTLFGVAFSLGCVIWEKSWKWHDENKAEEEAKATKNQAAGDKAAKAKADLEAALKEDAKAAQTRRENISKRAYALGQMAVQDTPFGIRDLQQRISDAVASRVNRGFGASEGGLSDADALKGAQEAAKEAIKSAYMEVNNSAIFAGMGPFVPMMSPDELEKCANDIVEGRLEGINMFTDTANSQWVADTATAKLRKAQSDAAGEDLTKARNSRTQLQQELAEIQDKKRHAEAELDLNRNFPHDNQQHIDSLTRQIAELDREAMEKQAAEQKSAQDARDAQTKKDRKDAEENKAKEDAEDHAAEAGFNRGGGGGE
jgi:hypothetical protein